MSRSAAEARPAAGCLGRHLHVVAHLEQRRDDHEDDEEHEHHVHERRDVDVALVVAGAASAAMAMRGTLLRSRGLAAGAFLLLFGDEADVLEARVLGHLA